MGGKYRQQIIQSLCIIHKFHFKVAKLSTLVSVENSHALQRIPPSYIFLQKHHSTDGSYIRLDNSKTKQVFMQESDARKGRSLSPGDRARVGSRVAAQGTSP